MTDPLATAKSKLTDSPEMDHRPDWVKAAA